MGIHKPFLYSVLCYAYHRCAFSTRSRSRPPVHRTWQHPLALWSSEQRSMRPLKDSTFRNFAPTLASSILRLQVFVCGVESNGPRLVCRVYKTFTFLQSLLCLKLVVDHMKDADLPAATVPTALTPAEAFLYASRTLSPRHLIKSSWTVGPD